jgi:nicotinamide-nucleotide amidase
MSETGGNGAGRGPRIWIVSTGTEILQGHYADTNAQWISQQLFGIGLRIDRHMAIPDDHDLLFEELENACKRCDLIIMTGGLGPTADDMNRQSVARVFRVNLVEDEASLNFIKMLFESRKRAMPPSNAVQAQFPEGATILQNKRGTAPGFFIAPKPETGLRASLLALPGPPREMRPMFSETALPIILDKFAGGRRVLRTLTIHTVGVAESHINDRMADLFDSDPKVGVALLAGRWRVDVRLTLQGDSEAENAANEAKWIDLICERIGEENIFGLDDVDLPMAIGKLLAERGETLALAESCTGGLIAKQITDVPGSSGYFLEGFVTYTNEAKTKTLGVPEELIKEYGAVSGEVAEAMAEGAQEETGADWALSVTGIAGPDGGTPEKPVGLVYFGLATPDGQIRHRRILGLGGDRSGIREFSAVTALDFLRRSILRASGPPGWLDEE